MKIYLYTVRLSHLGHAAIYKLCSSRKGKLAVCRIVNDEVTAAHFYRDILSCVVITLSPRGRFIDNFSRRLSNLSLSSAISIPSAEVPRILIPLCFA